MRVPAPLPRLPPGERLRKRTAPAPCAPPRRSLELGWLAAPGVRPQWGGGSASDVTGATAGAGF